MADSSKAMVIGTITFYMAAALIMVTVNKWVLTDTKIPIFFLAMQLGIAVILMQISKSSGLLKVQALNWETAKKLWKYIGLNVFGIVFSNFTLRYVDASIYQVVRGLILPITCFLSYMLEAKPPSKLAIGSCGIVTVGFLVGVGWSAFFGGIAGGGVRPIGVFFGLLSSVTTAYHSIVIKESLNHVGGSAIDLAFYGNAFSALIMVPLAIVTGELPVIFELATGEQPLGRLVWGVIITGIFGFLICVAGLLSVKVTSPVSHMVSSAMRGVLQTAISVYFFGDILTGSRIMSIFIIISGSVHYVWAKSVEQKAPAPSADYHKLENLEEGTNGDSK